MRWTVVAGLVGALIVVIGSGYLGLPKYSALSAARVALLAGIAIVGVALIGLGKGERGPIREAVGGPVLRGVGAGALVLTACLVGPVLWSGVWRYAPLVVVLAGLAWSGMGAAASGLGVVAGVAVAQEVAGSVAVVPSVGAAGVVVAGVCCLLRKEPSRVARVGVAVAGASVVAMLWGAPALFSVFGSFERFTVDGVDSWEWLVVGLVIAVAGAVVAWRQRDWFGVGLMSLVLTRFATVAGETTVACWVLIAAPAVIGVVALTRDGVVRALGAVALGVAVMRAVAFFVGGGRLEIATAGVVLGLCAVFGVLAWQMRGRAGEVFAVAALILPTIGVALVALPEPWRSVALVMGALMLVYRLPTPLVCAAATVPVVSALVDVPSHNGWTVVAPFLVLGAVTALFALRGSTAGTAALAAVAAHGAARVVAMGDSAAVELLQRIGLSTVRRAPGDARAEVALLAVVVLALAFAAGWAAATSASGAAVALAPLFALMVAVQALMGLVPVGVTGQTVLEVGLIIALIAGGIVAAWARLTIHVATARR
ncbi:hypothetical protein [Actinokineospora pegani]|uniref:hypothetical protein n=1 Tax=Actinokineospora pegani TaxID=2654637 RepID=UPI0012E9D0AD|nr:hypothetical protein [Actinokineospora pegani]